MLITAGCTRWRRCPPSLLLRERAVPQPRLAAPARLRPNGGVAAAPAAHLAAGRRLRDFAWLLACGACYQAGIMVVIALAAVYAEQVLGFKQSRP
jgi:UMF1 family MFS transporter